MECCHHPKPKWGYQTLALSDAKQYRIVSIKPHDGIYRIIIKDLKIIVTIFGIIQRFNSKRYSMQFIRYNPIIRNPFKQWLNVSIQQPDSFILTRPGISRVFIDYVHRSLAVNIITVTRTRSQNDLLILFFFSGTESS